VTVRAPVRLSEAGSLAKASTPEPFSTSKTSNWVARKGGLPPYVQHIAHDLVEKGGKTESEAIELAIGIVKNPPAAWGAEAKAAAAKAAAEWENKKGTSKPGSAAKSTAKSLAESRRRAPGISLADRVTLRTAAKARLRTIEEAFDIQTMMSLLTEGIGNDWTPALKRTASATSETARMEVHDGGQHVGFVMGRRGYERANPERWRAAGVNGRTVGDMCDTQAGAVDALKKHLEEAPARVSATSSGKHAVAEPEGYGGPTRFTEYPSEATARYAAGLPERPTKPEQTSKVAALGEMIAFDVVTLVGLEEELPSGMGVLQEAGFSRTFDEGKHPRGPHGKWLRVGAHVEYSHPNGRGHTFGRVESISGSRVKIKSLNGPTHTVEKSAVHGEHPGGISSLDRPSRTAAQNVAAYERNRLSSVTARKSKTVLNPTPATNHAPAIDSFEHKGPGGDAAMPKEVRDALTTIKPGETKAIAGARVKKERNGSFTVEGDRNLRSPWVAMQSIKEFRAERRENRGARGHTPMREAAVLGSLLEGEAARAKVEQ